MSEGNTDKRTAVQKIDDLERAMMSLYQATDTLAKEIGTIKEAIKLLGNKTDSIVKVTQRGEALSDESISKAMIENNVEELKQKVQNLIDQGLLQSEQTISENSFVVGREIDSSGLVTNPRMQFVLSTLKEEIRSKFIGKAVGEILNLEEGKWSFEILESYSIVSQEAQSLPEEAPVSTEAASN